MCACAYLYMCSCTYMWKQRLTSVSCHSLPCFLTLKLKHIDCLDSLGTPKMHLSPSSPTRVRVAGSATVSSSCWCWISHLMDSCLLAGTLPVESVSQPLFIFKNVHLFFMSLEWWECLPVQVSQWACESQRTTPDGVISHLPHVGSGESNSGHWASAP